MIMKTIIKTYTDYVLAYSKYIDKYMVNRSEEEAQAETDVCDNIYQSLDVFVRAISEDEEMHYDLMNILTITDNNYKIRMAENLKNFFDYLD